MLDIVLNFISNHSPALQVTVPMVAALLCIFFHKRAAHKIFCVVTLFSFILALSFITRVFGDDEVITYYMGGWEYPYGIEYKIDKLNSFFICLVSFSSFVLSFFAKKTVENEINDEKHRQFYSLFLLLVAGLFGILLTNDAFNIYVFLEISSLATYSLLAIGRNRRSLTAAFTYLVLGTIGATFILIAIGLLYINTGTLNITDLSLKFNKIQNGWSIYAAFTFFTLGVLMKIAIFPLHIWLTNAYAFAPSVISSFLSACATKVSLYIFIRFIVHVFGLSYSFNNIPLAEVMIPLSIAAIIVGSMSAIYNHNVKRVFAFSSVAQMGYITLMLALGTKLSFAASLLHVANHAFAKSLLFVSAGIIYSQTNRYKISEYTNLAKKCPLAFTGIVVGGLSLIGVPLTAGFISKWYMVKALLEVNNYFLIIVLLISSIMAVIYIWRIVEVMYFKAEVAEDKTTKTVSETKIKPSLGMSISAMVLIFANIFFGIFADSIYSISFAIAEYLI